MPVRERRAGRDHGHRLRGLRHPVPGRRPVHRCRRGRAVRQSRVGGHLRDQRELRIGRRRAARCPGVRRDENRHVRHHLDRGVLQQRRCGYRQPGQYRQRRRVQRVHPVRGGRRRVGHLDGQRLGRLQRDCRRDRVRRRRPAGSGPAGQSGVAAAVPAAAAADAGAGCHGRAAGAPSARHPGAGPAAPRARRPGHPPGRHFRAAWAGDPASCRAGAGEDPATCPRRLYRQPDGCLRRSRPGGQGARRGGRRQAAGPAFPRPHCQPRRDIRRARAAS